MITSLPILFGQVFAYQDILYQLESLGLFDFILPFLLLFAVIFGVLTHTKIFGDHKAVHILIALVVGLLGIRFPEYTDFLAIISPKLGIGLVILLFLIILTGMFVPKAGRGVMGWILMGIGVVIFLIILANTYSAYNGSGYGNLFSSELIGWMILIALLIGVIVAVVVGGSTEKSKVKEDFKNVIGSLFDRV